MNELEVNNKTFEDIKHIDEEGNEFWYARELQLALDYKEWRKFEGVIKKAKVSCENSGIAAFEHFVGADKTIQMPKTAAKIINDYKLTRYACYLIAQNGDSRKKVIALAQTYFAVQTRRQELENMVCFQKMKKGCIGENKQEMAIKYYIKWLKKKV